MNKDILLIDISHLFYKIIFNLKDLSNEEIKTGIIFGVTSYILQLGTNFNTNKFVFVFDSKASDRRKVYPEYKIKRRQIEKTPEEEIIFRVSFRQLEELKNAVLLSLGFKNIFWQEGKEADDIISRLSESDEHNFIIISNDNDLLQLLKENVSIYNLSKKSLYTKKHFIEEYGIEPKQWVDVKAVSGCTSDCVKGVEGVGEKTAIKFLKNELKPTSKKYQSIVSEEGKRIFERNLPLVQLPYEGTGTFELREEKFRSVDFIEMVEKYGFRSFMNGSGLNKWNEIFVGG